MKMRAVEDGEVASTGSGLATLFLNHSHDIGRFEIPAAQGDDLHRPTGKRLTFFGGTLLAGGTSGERW